MTTIVTRAGKGSPLTNAELDQNFLNLNSAKLEAGDLSPYLLSATAASTYQTIAGMSSYLTTAGAASTYLPLSGGTLSGNLSISGTALRLTGDLSGAVTSRLFIQTSTANGQTLLSVMPSGTAVNSQFQAYNSSDPSNSSIGSLVASATQVRIVSGSIGTGTVNPITFIFSNTEAARFDPTTRNFLIGSSTDDTVNKLQVTGSAKFTGDSSFTSTGALLISAGTTAQRPGTATNGMLRYNSTTSSFEGYVGGAWGAIGGGGGSSGPLTETSQTISSNYTVTSGKNGLSVGPVTIATGVTVTIGDGQRWVII